MSGIGSSIDSLYEYLLKGAILCDDERLLFHHALVCTEMPLMPNPVAGPTGCSADTVQESMVRVSTLMRPNKR